MNRALFTLHERLSLSFTTTRHNSDLSSLLQNPKTDTTSLAPARALSRPAARSLPSPLSQTSSLLTSLTPQRRLQHQQPQNQPPQPTPSPPRLRLRSTAPNFQAQTTLGPVDFHTFISSSWAILFSHPADFTPVCTTELGAFSRLHSAFRARSVKLLGLSANDLSSHTRWIDDINAISSTDQQFPIIADTDRHIAQLYDMLDAQDLENIDARGLPFTVRAVFVIDPAKTIRLITTYPASVGRNTAEVSRVVDALQMGNREGVTTPIDWTVGEDVSHHVVY